MKKLIICCLALLFAVGARAQSPDATSGAAVVSDEAPEYRNFVHMGVGAFITGRAAGETGGDVWGGGLVWGYGRALSPWFALDASMVYGNARFGKELYESTIGVSAGVIVTPMPFAFRFLKAGLAAGWGHRQLYASTASGRQKYATNDIFGFDAILRLYVIDNSHWQLFAAGQPAFRVMDGKLGLAYGSLTACLGYKF